MRELTNEEQEFLMRVLDRAAVACASAYASENSTARDLEFHRCRSVEIDRAMKLVREIGPDAGVSPYGGERLPLEEPYREKEGPSGD